MRMQKRFLQIRKNLGPIGDKPRDQGNKKTIKIALKLLIKMSKSDKEKEKYKTGLVLLKDFIDFQELEGK